MMVACSKTMFRIYTSLALACLLVYATITSLPYSLRFSMRSCGVQSLFCLQKNQEFSGQNGIIRDNPEPI